MRITKTRVGAAAAGVTTVAAMTMFLLSGPSTITVDPGGDLQAAINSAQPGDTIVLQAGADYHCDCVFPVKQGTEYVTIQSSRADEIQARQLLSTAPTTEQYALLARVHSKTHYTPTFRALPSAHHYRLVGLEIRPRHFKDDGTLAPAPAILELGLSGTEQDTVEEVPHSFEISKSWIHGYPEQEVHRCVALNSGATTITSSWISDCHGKGYDTQAIGSWNGPGPYLIDNNYLEGAGENVMFGGSPASVQGLVPTDIRVTRNYVRKPLSWYANDPSYAGIHWSVKNLFELKNARKVLVEGNVFDGNWTDAQAGRAIVFTPRPSDSGTWATIEDVTFQNNIIRNVGSGLLILGADEAPAPTETRLRRLRVSNNLWFIDGARFSSNGVFATVINKTEDVTIESNTAIHTGNIISTDYAPNVRFAYRNNISRHNDFGIFGSGSSIGNSSINQYFPASDIKGNVIAREVNGPGNAESLYPAGNFFPATLAEVGFVDLAGGNYRLSASSAYKGKGTGGADPGCDIDLLNAALGGSGTTPTPLPTASTAPSATPSASPQPSGVPSADGTKGPTVVDSQLAVWTLGPQPELRTLRNGAQAGGGQGKEYKYLSKVVYVAGLDSQWYRWTGNGWTWHSVTEPGGGTPTPTPVPSPTSQPLPSPSPSATPTPKPSPSPTPSLPVCTPNQLIGNPARCLCLTGARCTGGNARCL